MTCCNCTRSPSTSGSVTGQFGPQCHSFLYDFVLREINDFLNDLVNIDARLFRIRFPHQRSNPSNHVTRPIAIADNAAHGLPRFIEVWSRPGKPAQRGTGICDDGGKGLVNFVGNGGRHLSQSRHPRDVKQLCLRLAQGIFSELALGQVEHERDALVSPSL